jgi:purine-binding chemotaxis protein CheW
MTKALNNRDLLRKRSISNAIREDNAVKETKNTLYALSFSLLGNNYAFETKYISEVLHIKEITKVPGTPDIIEGVINLRGSIVPVINTKELFSFGSKGLTEQNRLIILSHKAIYLGIICDSINDIINTDCTHINPLTPNISASLESYSKGVINDNTLLLDSIKIITSPTIIMNK